MPNDILPNMNLKEELQNFLDHSTTIDAETAKKYGRRIAEGNLTRDENPISHFCAYFLPYNIKTKQVLYGNHKKSGKWLAPGGHIDRGESLFETLNREICEELGVENFFKSKPDPFLLTITPINQDQRKCAIHFDIWHLMETDGCNFNVDMTEYHEVRWVSIPVAKKLTTDAANQTALDLLEQKNVK